MLFSGRVGRLFNALTGYGRYFPSEAIYGKNPMNFVWAKIPGVEAIFYCRQARGAVVGVMKARKRRGWFDSLDLRK
jgi:hypothetical protein